jgi:hypothetical protein
MESYYRRKNLLDISKHVDLTHYQSNTFQTTRGDNPLKERDEKKDAETYRKEAFKVRPPELKNWAPPQISDSHKLFKTPFLAYVFGPINSGKTSITSHIIKTYYSYQPNGKLYFQKCYLFTNSEDPTLLALPYFKNWKLYQKDESRRLVFTNLDVDGHVHLERILKAQQQSVEEKGRARADRCLLIFDDVASAKRFFNKEVTGRLIFTLRHANISCFFLFQQFNSLQRRFRIQANYVIGTKNINNQEKDALYDSFSPFWVENKKEFFKIIDSILKDEYSFVLLDRTKSPYLLFRDNRLEVVYPKRLKARVEEEMKKLLKK